MYNEKVTRSQGFDDESSRGKSSKGTKSRSGSRSKDDSEARVNKLLSRDPSSLTEADRSSLLKHADNLYRKSGRWMEIGRCVWAVFESTPELSRLDRVDQLANAGLLLTYDTAAKARRVYAAYRESPEEVDDLGLDIADRLKSKSPEERQHIRKKYKSGEAIKKFLSKPGAAKGSPAQAPKATKKWIEVAIGDMDDMRLSEIERLDDERIVRLCAGWAKEFKEWVTDNSPITDTDEELELDGEEGLSGDARVFCRNGEIRLAMQEPEPYVMAKAILLAACTTWEFLQDHLEE